MNAETLMSAEEIHDFGIEVVASQMKKEGYEIDGVNPVLC
jgi:methanogenic corrinoid protein MtbC1